MGMMLETTATRLFTDRGGCHHGSPDKDPAVRLRTLTDAGRLAVPFTTGILVGIGENRRERAESIMAIRKVHKAFGHVQEVIVQNFLAKDDTAMRDIPDADIDEFRADHRRRAPAARPRHADPGATEPRVGGRVSRPDRRGRRRLGRGVAADPGSRKPRAARGRISKRCRISRPRPATSSPNALPHNRNMCWRDSRGSTRASPGTSPPSRCRKPVWLGRIRSPVGLPWQEPDQTWESSGRTDLHAAIDTDGRITETRSDLGSAFGDWDTVRQQVLSLSAPVKVDTDVLTALRAAERDPAGCSDADYLALATADGPGLDAVAALADDLRRAAVGEDVTYVVNRNINFTNICYTGCRFCAFAQRKGDADAYSLSAAEVADRAWEAHVAGASEVCMQGGIDPELPVTGYADLVRAVKERVPTMHVHAFSPMEVVNGASRAGLSVRDWLIALREAGLDTIPGTAAEILDDEVRWVLTKGKLPTATWIDVVTTAHEVGLRSSSTMMYGHVDHPRHWVAHLRVLRDIQDRTGGFTEFVPLPFVHQSAPLYLAGAARPGPTNRDNRAVHALARIMLHGRIPNVQTSWVKLGVTGTQVMLRGGANDLGGTLMEETISRMAGSQHGSAKTVAELRAIAEQIGRPAVERTTAYGRRAGAPAA